MYARVTQFHIVPDKLDSFLAALQDAVPHAHQQRGFRALIVLRAEAPASTADVRVMSLWDSIEDLQAGEQNFYFYQALAKVMSSSKVSKCSSPISRQAVRPSATIAPPTKPNSKYDSLVIRCNVSHGLDRDCRGQ